MTDRAIFNRRYTSFQPGSTPVYLLNGAGVTTTAPTTYEFTAGENLIQGDVVYVSGSVVLQASAASGVPSEEWQAVGVTSEAATTSSTVTVVLDENVVVSSSNLVHETSMTPGQYYFLASEQGKLVSATPPSGITVSGGYAAQAPIGIALSSSELHVEIGTPITLFELFS